MHVEGSDLALQLPPYADAISLGEELCDFEKILIKQ